MFLTVFLVFAFHAGAVADVGPAELAAALRRNEQAPLPPGNALRLAKVARDLGDRDAEITLLERAIADAEIAEVARIELAQALIDRDAARAASLVVASLERPATSLLRAEAVEIVRQSLVDGVAVDDVPGLRSAIRRLPRSQRRTLEAVAADPGSVGGRARLARLLERDAGDRAALEAARRLERVEAPTPKERWLIARCLYRHALYGEAAALLEPLTRAQNAGVPATEVLFLRGRCDFRLDRWKGAARWYRRALAVVQGRTRRAEIEAHLARTLELGGDLDGAAEAARRSVVARTTDDRRLLLIRLRLRQGRRDLAERGLAAIRSSSKRDRARMVTALTALAGGRTEEGLKTLLVIRRRPWRGPARVLAARELLRSGRPEEALARLEAAIGDLGTFWVFEARRVMSELPGTLIDDWRKVLDEETQTPGKACERALRRWGTLEFDSEIRREVARRFQKTRSIGPVPQALDVGGLAGILRDLGLEEEAVRWDPGSFPTGTPEETLWSAGRFLAAGAPWRAIRTGDAAWRSWDARYPVDLYPNQLIEALYPMPALETVREVAKRTGIDWAVVAGVAREESRWNPRVLSRVGARGLMQLMPLTAASVAEREGREAPSPEDLFESDLSLELGAAELARLIRRFDGFTAAAVASYNAGEAQTALWVEQCGPQCDEARFVAAITFEATRTYTADVLASAEVYRRLTERTASPDGVLPSGTATARFPR